MDFFSLKRLNELSKVVRLVHENKIQYYMDTREQLCAKYNKHKAKNNILELIAILCVVFKRVYDINLHDVQIKALLCLVDNYFIQLDTGEGKTLVTVAYALINNGRTHIITCNNFLAEEMYNTAKKSFDYLQLPIELNTEPGVFTDKSEVYSCGTMVSSAERLAFDVLFDEIKMCSIGKNPKNDGLVQHFNTVVIDEADMMLADMSNTEIHVSSGETNSIDVERFNSIYNDVSGLDRYDSHLDTSRLIMKQKKHDYDYIYEQATQTVMITNTGAEKLKKFTDSEFILVHACLKAMSLVEGRDYVVDRNYVHLIDSNGRITYGSTMGEFVNEFIHLKHGLPILGISNPETTSSYISILLKYKKAVGMSATMYECSEDVKKYFKSRVVQIPRKTSNLRKDNRMELYEDATQKYSRMVNILDKNIGKTVIIICYDISEAKFVYDIVKGSYKSDMILPDTSTDIEREKLNEIEGKVLVSTPMLGRGTDIRVNGAVLILMSAFKSLRAEKQVIGRVGRQGDSGETYRIFSKDDVWIRFLNSNKRKINKAKINKTRNRFDKEEFYYRYKSAVFNQIYEAYKFKILYTDKYCESSEDRYTLWKYVNYYLYKYRLYVSSDSDGYIKYFKNIDAYLLEVKNELFSKEA